MTHFTTVSQLYEQRVQTGVLQADPVQAQVIPHLQALADQLAKPSWWWSRGPVTGLYMWGDVGTGKTCLMDLFYEALPSERKMRQHFHRFMRETHLQLRDRQGEKDPLQAIAKQLAKQTDILCFDELFVSDIVDAMLLGTLLTALFKQGMSLVATSNVPPQDLYRNGLQRERFLPAIAQLERHTQVYQLKGEHDYRLQTHQRSGTYYIASSHDALKQHFLRLTHGHEQWQYRLTVGSSHQLQTMAYHHDVVWFSFVDIIGIPNCQRDYLELAQCFPTIFISDVPSIGAHEHDMICNFIYLVDIFYDAQVKLILQASAEPKNLYTAGTKLFEYQRTVSRLQEMQSQEYLAKPHLTNMKTNIPAQLNGNDWEE